MFPVASSVFAQHHAPYNYMGVTTIFNELAARVVHADSLLSTASRKRGIPQRRDDHESILILLLNGASLITRFKKRCNVAIIIDYNILCVLLWLTFMLVIIIYNIRVVCLLYNINYFNTSQYNYLCMTLNVKLEPDLLKWVGG